MEMAVNVSLRHSYGEKVINVLISVAEITWSLGKVYFLFAFSYRIIVFHL